MNQGDVCMESIQSKFLKAILRIVNLKKMWEVTGEELRKNIEKKQSSESHEPPKKIRKKYSISEKELNGYCFYVMEPLNNVRQKHILYLHGGGCVYEITSLHWEFLGKLVEALQCTITVTCFRYVIQQSRNT